MSNNDIAKKIEVIKCHHDFCTLPERNIKELATKAKRLFFKRGDFVFHAGDPSDYCHFVESGCVLLSKNSSIGKSITFLLLEKGATLNAVTCFKPCPKHFTARVVRNASVLAIPRKDFKEWVFRDPVLTCNIICTLGDLLDGAYHRLLDHVNESAEQRIINTLSMISSRLGATLPLTNNDLADLIGTSRETAARVIIRLQKYGLLSKSRGQITILNASQLKFMSTNSAIFI